MSKRLIYNFGSRYGFFSEFNNMVLTYLYCLNNDIEFSLFDQNQRFSNDHDWLDYFEPFCNSVFEKFHKQFNRRDYFGNMSYSSIVKDFLSGDKNILKGYERIYYRFVGDLLKWKYNFDFYTYEVFANARNHKNENIFYNLTEYGIKGDLQESCQHIINMIWRYNTKTEISINQIKDTINISDKYVGIHIRGGDKFLEYEIQKVDLYINKIREHSELRKAFVLTDDYGVIEKLESKYIDWDFKTLCGKEERGYFHDEFMKRSKMRIREKHLRLFASIDFLANSELFVGTFNSNPGMYLGMRMDKEKTYGIDVYKWQIW